MARKRFISSEISSDARVAEVAETNPAAALMWPWFLTAVDDWGRMTANPHEVRLTVFPGFAYTSKDVQAAMELYDQAGLIHLYQVNGNRYLQMNPASFYRYNSYIQKSRQLKDSSKLPPPPDHPWSDYWSEGRQDRPLQAIQSANETDPSAEGGELQKAALSADKRQEVAESALSPSPSPSLSPKEDKGDRENPSAPAGTAAVKRSSRSSSSSSEKAGGDLYGTAAQELVRLLDGWMKEQTPGGTGIPSGSWGASVNMAKQALAGGKAGAPISAEDAKEALTWAVSDGFWKPKLLAHGMKLLRDVWAAWTQRGTAPGRRGRQYSDHTSSEPVFSENSGFRVRGA